MTEIEALENKVACIQAFIRGEKIEVRSQLTGAWGPNVSEKLIFDKPGDHYRIAPKPEPKIPGGVFWVRFTGNPDRERLVTMVEGDMMHYVNPRGSVDSNNYLVLATAAKNWQWSHDRITWKEFTEV